VHGVWAEFHPSGIRESAGLEIRFKYSAERGVNNNRYYDMDSYNSYEKSISTL
jgi:hypothetical protein